MIFDTYNQRTLMYEFYEYSYANIIKKDDKDELLNIP